MRISIRYHKTTRILPIVNGDNKEEEGEGEKKVVMMFIPSPHFYGKDRDEKTLCKHCEKKLDLDKDDMFVEYEGKYFCIDCFTIAFSKTLKAATEKIDRDNRNQRVFRKQRN